MKGSLKIVILIMIYLNKHFHVRNFGQSLKRGPCSLNYPGEKERIQFKKILVIERIFEYIYCESNRFKLKSSTAIF